MRQESKSPLKVLLSVEGIVYFLFFTVSLLFALAAQASSTITASTCNGPDVQAAINVAKDGDTVVIPAGRCTWTQTVTVGKVVSQSPIQMQSKSITIQGAGMDQTIIVDNVPKPAATGGPIFRLITKSRGLTRLTGLTVDGGTGPADPHGRPMVTLGGFSQTWRLDHLRFITTNNFAVGIYGFTFGVMDHCIFDLNNWKHGVYVFHELWPPVSGQGFGDGSWADALALGTDKAVFIEDNIFRSPSVAFAHEGWSGQRVVFRHNTLVNTLWGNHGTESPGRYRGARSFEIYNNVATYTGAARPKLFGFRSGAGVIFNNTITGPFTVIGLLSHVRDYGSVSSWGQCDGTSPFDVNDGIVYESGTYTGPAVQAKQGLFVFTLAGNAWTPQQWVGYSIHNTTQNTSSIIVSNTQDTITTRFERSWAHTLVGWNTGDTFTILRATICLDQIGRGKGNLLTGVTPTPQTWPHQKLEPVYAWNNTLNGMQAKLHSDSPHIQEGRDFYNNTPMPGYTSYIYPHPLTRTINSISPPTAP